MSKDFTPFDESPIKGTHYRWTALSALGDFLDGGAVVAGAASLVFWREYFHLTSNILGIIGAVSPAAFGAGVGALIAGPLGDKFGRKAIYTYDLIIMFIGAILVAASINPITLIIGYLLVGLSSGIDVPTAWSLIAEYSPRKHRGNLMSFTLVFYDIGTIAMLALAIITSRLGVNSFRVLFGVLAALAIITWILRRELTESPRWAALKGKEEEIRKAIERLEVENLVLSPNNPESNFPSKISLANFVKAFAVLIPLYTFWIVPSGTFRIFLPFIVQVVFGTKSPILGYVVQMIWYATDLIAALTIRRHLIDRISRRLLYVISSTICAISFALPLIMSFKNLEIALANVILFGFGAGLGIWVLIRMWSAEVFPTEVRTTGQAIVWGSARCFQGVWSLFVPTIVSTIGYSLVALVATVCFVASAIIGGVYGPESQGKSLETLVKEFYAKNK